LVHKIYTIFEGERMNTTSPQRRFVLTSILGGIGLLSACSSGVKLDDLSTMKTDEAKGSNIASQPWNDPKSPLFQRSIYFDFDEYTIKPQYQNMLQAGAAFLKQNPQQKIMIQGNTDDRGTAEYNLALGQRRSDAVSQMEAVSLGKEKPKAEGNTEAAWAENRRADIIYITK
jgi:peptidoglycan-associated lipoprotein